MRLQSKQKNRFFVGFILLHFDSCLRVAARAARFIYDCCAGLLSPKKKKKQPTAPHMITLQEYAGVTLPGSDGYLAHPEIRVIALNGGWAKLAALPNP